LGIQPTTPPASIDVAPNTAPRLMNARRLMDSGLDAARIDGFLFDFRVVISEGSLHMRISFGSDQISFPAIYLTFRTLFSQVW
jgi:hypothetical protein